MFTRLTIKTKFVFVTSILCLCSIMIAAHGVISLDTANSAVKSIYEDRVIGLGQLSAIQHMLQQNQMSIATATLERDPGRINVVIDVVSARSAQIDSHSKAYMATQLTEEKKTLVAQFEHSRRQFMRQGIEPALAALRAGDMESAAELVRQTEKYYMPAQTLLDALIKSEFDASKDDFEESQHRYAAFQMTTITISILALLVGISMAWWIISQIMSGMSETIRIADTISAGDLSQEFESNRRDEFGTLVNSLGEMEDKLTDLVSSIKKSSDTVQSAADEIAVGNLELSARTEQQAASIEQTASTMDQLAHTVHQTAANALQATRIVADASGVAQQGRAVVNEVVSTMESIRTSSQKIAEIISVIDGIAFQTNILAINASVEAARAVSFRRYRAISFSA